MRRLRKHLYENFQDENFNAETRYELAYKRVKRIKGFYVHVLVYVLVNIYIIASSIYKGNFVPEDLSRWEFFSTPIFWGVGLIAHGLSVFGRDLFFSSNWEERKIKELMDKDRNQK
ncbi:2TM domain-containing protein [Flavobacterium granuli]|uniref:2TM domain-containing protein n=1 Tax=Flavobacterium granuli TaxID=280093 RepID=A0ABU1S4X3_9FLAO|nr:2TM domain-containing protein [Flavobacterium granuli]MDR6846096.1 hypothetical protein [Flavobacterium granuli]